MAKKAINYEDIKFGSRLHKFRIDAGMTLSQLSKASGISIQAISHYEHGTRKPKVEKIFFLSQALDVKPKELAGERFADFKW